VHLGLPSLERMESEAIVRGIAVARAVNRPTLPGRNFPPRSKWSAKTRAAIDQAIQDHDGPLLAAHTLTTPSATLTLHNVNDGRNLRPEIVATPWSPLEQEPASPSNSQGKRKKTATLGTSYAAAAPIPLIAHRQDSDALADLFSGLQTPDRVQSENGLRVLKTAAIAAGVPDADVQAALMDRDPDAYRNLALRIHPYARRAAAEAGNFYSLFQFHDGGYYVMRQMRLDGRLPANAVILNVDPHSDLVRSGERDPNITAAGWIANALDDGLAADYVQMRFDDKGQPRFRRRSNGPGREFGATEEIPQEEAVRMLRGRPVFLTVDADAFSLDPSHAPEPYHLTEDELPGRFQEIERFVRASGGDVIAVNAAISPEYIDHERARSVRWLHRWRHEAGDLAARLAPGSRPRLGISIFLGWLFMSSDHGGRYAVAVGLAPALETALVGALMVLSPKLAAVHFVVAAVVIPLLAGLLFVATHPSVCHGDDPAPRRPTRGERAWLFVEGVMYGAMFVFLPLSGTPDPWLSAYLLGALVHAMLNGVAWAKGEMLSIAGATKEDRAAFALVDGLAAARRGDVSAAMASVRELLDGTARDFDIQSIDGRLSAIERSLDSGSLDRDRLAAAFDRAMLARFGRKLSLEEARLELQRLLTSGAATEHATALPAAPAAGASVVLVDETLLARLPEIVREAMAASGGATFIAQSEALAEAIRRTAKGADVEVRPEMFRAAGSGFSVSLAQVSALLSKAGMGPVSRVIASSAVALDPTGLAGDDPLRAAIFVILAAVGSVSLSAGQLDRIDAVARVV
ncbi:MAG: hypothetical protein JO102_00685, partial [Elusimicrobia bacterium]|nr:hypothetical protein [Elusimicrobiota bacterium]